MFKKMAIKIAMRFAKNAIEDALKDEALKTKYIKLINEKIDIPKMSEKREAALLDEIWDAVEIVVEDVILTLELPKSK